MTKISEHISVTAYIKATTRTIDGLAWISVCITSLVLAIGLIFGYVLAPIRDIGDKPKAIVLLLSSPLLIFLILVRLRQLPFSDNKASPFIRAALCIAAFLTINFYRW
ncbi:hypothetical protein CJO96_15810 [Ralstonia solanacearum]|nr:hypothetical protein CJO89_16460 [Ralstonia solanacearum]AXW72471.1 hypothetical protein CJO96_15810 [Ralstonia solanacearum]